MLGCLEKKVPHATQLITWIALGKLAPIRILQNTIKFKESIAVTTKDMVINVLEI